MMRLYGYWRSSCTWRVRIALHYKKIPFEYIPVHLVRDGGEQFSSQHRARNAMAQVPVLEWTDSEGATQQLSQSMAMMELLEEMVPQNPILPSTSLERARVRQLAEVINAGIQPVQNLAVLKQVIQLGGDKIQWGQHWIQMGLNALEAMVQEGAKTQFLAADSPTIADFCLIPQLYNARRFQCDLTQVPSLLCVEERCQELEAFQLAHPDQQSDAQ